MTAFAEDIRKGGVHSAWMGGKTVLAILENGYEVEIRFTDGSSARFMWVDDNGEQLKGKLQCKSMGTHIRAKTATLGWKNGSTT